ncbi:hypothetical protein FM104_07530 [Microbacterium esteraromaticum]|uniref:Uncharacterized protein n=2 Tax=Microbacterium esteraromaticum TaxID=57043 RepID=A0A1R4JHD4_9MICO|nr:hypothetical protein FM104_07530 [Microbacterium esteraromaticum]
MAVSETCVEGSDPQCIDVDGQYVLHPASFDKATVEEAVVSGQQDNAVEITFTSEGAAVLSTVTDRAARAGADARLLLKIGDDIRGAIEVKEALGGDEITIALSPDENPQDVVDLLSKG